MVYREVAFGIEMYEHINVCTDIYEKSEVNYTNK